MNPTTEEALFALAITKPAGERARFLDRECGADNVLRASLEALLASHDATLNPLATQAETARPTIKLELADAPDEVVGQTLGRYKLLEQIGEGGCGVVYVAEQTEPVRRQVAYQAEMRQREAEALFQANGIPRPSRTRSENRLNPQDDFPMTPKGEEVPCPLALERHTKIQTAFSAQCATAIPPRCSRTAL